MPVDRVGGDRPNIVWLLVDSIRRYPGGDFRGKLPFMERFAREAVEFETVVTTAPSTIMSITAMMTGLPAYFLARNYDQFRFEGSHRPSLSRVLKESGYSSWAFLRGTETREKFDTFLDPVPRKLWPGDLRHGEKWRNRDLNRLLDRVLEAGIPRPAFLFFHFNPKTRAETDPHVSEKVEGAYLRLRQESFDDENTIWVVCSDHGYPDPSTGISSEWEKKTRLSHDLVLTDDNILIPLSIRYPGCRPRKVEQEVSALDLFPTLLELAGVPEAREIGRAVDGLSLVPLMEGGAGTDRHLSRYFRCDSRLMLQTGRATAIRSRNFKYIRYHDRNRVAPAGTPEAGSEVLIDLRTNPREERNLLGDGPLAPEIRAVLMRHRTEFERSEERGVECQVEYLLARQKEILERSFLSGNGAGAIMVLVAFEPNTAGYAEIGLLAISRMMPNARLDVLTDSENLSDSAFSAVIRQIFQYSQNGELDAPDLSTSEARPYDFSIAFVQDPSAPLTRDLLRLLKKVTVKRRLVIDCNFNVHRPRNYWYYRFRAFLGPLSHLSKEPAILVDQARALAGALKRGLLRRFGFWERWDEAEAVEGEK